MARPAARDPVVVPQAQIDRRTGTLVRCAGDEEGKDALDVSVVSQSRDAVIVNIFIGGARGAARRAGRGVVRSLAARPLSSLLRNHNLQPQGSSPQARPESAPGPRAVCRAAATLIENRRRGRTS